jgi:CelD/BcsL family acetyltransferase involved in cellulose biosynthesis
MHIVDTHIDIGLETVRPAPEWMVADDREPAIGAIACRVLRSFAEIDAVATAWDALLEESACNRAFSSLEWFRAACETDNRIAPCVIVAERRGRPVAILPLVIDAGDGSARFATRLSDYNDIIAPEAERHACVGLLRFALSGDVLPGGIVLNFLRPDSNCIAALRAIFDDDRIAAMFDVERICPYLDLEADGGDYLGARSRASRKDLFRRRRAAERAGAATIILDPRSFRPSDLPGIFLALHESRFGSTSPLVAGEHRAFVEVVLPGLFASGRTLAVALEHEGRIVAIDLLHVGARSLCSWNGGFEQSAAWLSPGTLVIDAGIRAAIDRGCAEYDMLRGTEAYKLSVCNARRRLGRFEF